MSTSKVKLRVTKNKPVIVPNTAATKDYVAQFWKMYALRLFLITVAFFVLPWYAVNAAPGISAWLFGFFLLHLRAGYLAWRTKDYPKKRVTDYLVSYSLNYMVLAVATIALTSTLGQYWIILAFLGGFFADSLWDKLS